MSALSKKTILILLMCLHGLSYAADQGAPLKYKDYAFTPNYAQPVSDNTQAVSVLKDALGSGKKIDLFGSAVLETDTVVAYIIGFTREGVNEYRQKSRELASKGILIEHPTFDGVSVIKDNEVIDLLKVSHRPKKGQERQLWPLGSLGGYEFFGCLHEQPVFKANLFNEENPDLFVITGTGYQDSDLRGGGISGSLALHIFSSENYKEILELELTEMNYKPKHPEGAARKDYYYPKSNYPARILKFENNEGRKRYSKLFIKDFDENNKLDLLVWTREYQSRKVTKDNKPGFELADNKYVWYEENNTGTGFNARTIDIKMAEKWLNEFDLTWTSGWPNETLCKKGKKSFPLITIDDDPILKK